MNAPRSGCPINLTLEMLGDRWSLIVIRDLMFGNRRHFRELLTGQRGRGIGQALVSEAIAQARTVQGIEQLLLAVAVTTDMVHNARIPSEHRNALIASSLAGTVC
jgi:GNAT superfamily N-acetyltransferase